MANNKKYLILGADGFIGRHMFKKLTPARAIGTSHSFGLENCIQFDATETNLKDVVADPAEIRHCFILYGDTLPDSCAQNPEKSHAVNVESTKRVIDQLKHWRIPLTFTSSESVFDGTRANSMETDPANPIMLYGRQKLDIEHYLESSGQVFSIARLGKVFGSTSTNEKLFTGWINAIENGESSIRCATDQIFSPIFVNDVVNGLLLMAEKDVRGIFHLCGNKRESRMELLEMVVEEVRKFRTVNITLEPCSIDDFPLIERRPKDVSMKPDKLIAATGLKITPTQDVCRKIVEDYYTRTGAR